MKPSLYSWSMEKDIEIDNDSGPKTIPSNWLPMFSSPLATDGFLRPVVFELLGPLPDFVVGVNVGLEVVGDFVAP
jgi:hypothetical protein